MSIRSSILILYKVRGTNPYIRRKPYRLEKSSGIPELYIKAAR